MNATSTTKKPQPKFATKDGMSVQAISLNGVSQYRIKNGPYFVAYARSITEVAKYVDLTELREVRSNAD